jgi:hypothetical protein
MKNFKLLPVLTLLLVFTPVISQTPRITPEPPIGKGVVVLKLRA